MDQFCFNPERVANQRVVVRVDFNVPMNNGKIIDTGRIDETIPTLKALIHHNCKIILISHLGSPKGKIDPNLTLKPCAEYLEKQLNQKIFFSSSSTLEENQSQSLHLQKGEILLIENLRFNPAEEHPELNRDFAFKLSQLGDFFINDAFACCHRNHSSIVPICQFFKKNCMPGLLVEKEIRFLQQISSHPNKPYLAIIGGAKVESKIKLFEKIINSVDAIMIVGGMSIPFLNATANILYSPLVNDQVIEIAKKILDLAKTKNIKIFLPIDLITSESTKSDIHSKTILVEEGCQSPNTPVDIGPKTIDTFTRLIPHYNTIFWNGPAGVFETSPFNRGTKAIASAIANHHCTSVVGGGESAAAITSFDLKNKFTHVSTGGGASIEFIENGSLIGIEALQLANRN